MTRPADLRRLVAAHRRLLAAYRDERQSIFTLFANARGEVDDLEGQLLLSIMDENIADAEAALAFFCPTRLPASGLLEPGGDPKTGQANGVARP